MKDYAKPGDLLGQNGLGKQLQKRLLEKAMGAELTVPRGDGQHDAAGKNSGHARNGSPSKTLTGEFGHLELAPPRDRNGPFEPQIVAQGPRRFEGFDQAIIRLDSRGLTPREIAGHLLAIYGVEVSPTLVLQVTAAGVPLGRSGRTGRWRRYIRLFISTQSAGVGAGAEGGGVAGAGDHADRAEGGAGRVGGQTVPGRNFGCLSGPS